MNQSTDSVQRLARRLTGRSDRGSVLIITFIMVTVCGVMIAGTLNFISAAMRSQPAIAQRSVAVESATSAMRAAILMQVAKGPEGCLDPSTLPATTFDTNGSDTQVTCTVLEALDTSSGRYGVITTQSDASARGFSGWRGGTDGELKDVDGDVFVNGGWLDRGSTDLLVRGTSGNRYRIEYSNSTETAPGVSTTRTPTLNRYRVADTVMACDAAALADDKYPTATSLINGRPYGHVTPICSTSSESPTSNGVAWWERAGDDPDPTDLVPEWVYPRLPALPSLDRDGKFVDLTPTCRMYYPGRYDDALTLSSGREHYFASGIYLFRQPISVTAGASVVFGSGRNPGCATDSDLALNPSALTNHAITGRGATILLEQSARITVTNASLQVNRRISTPATRGSEGIGIRTVNFGTSTAVLQVPRDRVQQGEYPCVESSPGVCATPLTPDPSNSSGTVDVGAHSVSLPTTPNPTVLTYSGSTLAHNQNAVLVDFTGATSQETSRFEVDGNIFVPGAQVTLRTASSGAAERAYAFTANGGIVASRVNLDARRLPTDAADNWYVGVSSSPNQLRVALRAAATTETGRIAVSRAVIQVRSDGTYVVNSWTVDPDDGGATQPVVTTLAPPTTITGGTLPTTTLAPNSTCPTITGWRAQYYNSRDLAGNVVLCRDEAAINVNWGSGGPGSPVGTDGFSARWTRSVTFAAGTFRFNVSADDGYRLIVDGEVVAGCWCEDGLTSESVDVDLTAGAHTIVLEYRDVTGAASASLSWGLAGTTTTTTTTSSTTTTTIPITTTTISPSVCPTTFSGWKAEYFTNRTLSGSPAVCRNDANLQMDWTMGSPHPIIPADNFSARWTRTENWVGGRYRFDVRSDDGIRVRIDGVIVYDQWWDQPIGSNETINITIGAGQHTIVVEYYEAGGYAQIAFSWEPISVTCPTATGTNWIGEYYASNDLSGSRVLCRQDANLNFNWGSNAPAAEVPADNFSARWTRTANFAAGTYRFGMNADDGVRLYVDGVLVKADWASGATRYNVVDVPLTAGNHTIVLEYWEGLGLSNVDLSWRQVGCPTITGWRAEYYNNESLSGDWVLCRDDASPNVDWGTNAPDPSLPSDNFSVRWTRTETFAAGRYRFNMGADNGSRLYINGTLVNDFWGPTTGYQTRSPEVTLPAGDHTIVYEFREQGGAARSALSWQLTACQSTSSTTGWRGEYYANTTFSGTPICRSDSSVNFNWGTASPMTGIPTDNFSVRWTKDVTLAAGNYRFRIDRDDTWRLYFNGAEIGSGGCCGVSTVDIGVPAGTHTITLEYTEATSTAKAILGWAPLGRYVRVQLAGTNNLHMAEVRVNGWDGAGNSAVRSNFRPASQSSTFDFASASRAVDTNTDGRYNRLSVSHTNADANAWWQVDLGSNFAIDNVVIFNRTDCCSTRLTNYTVFVSETDMSSRTYAQLLADPLVEQITMTTSFTTNRTHTFAAVQ